MIRMQGSEGAPVELGAAAWYVASSIDQSDGTAVSSWADSSGNGLTVTQGNGSFQPTYETNVLNGHPVVRFDPSAARLLLGASASDWDFGSGPASTLTVMAVIIPNDPSLAVAGIAGTNPLASALDGWYIDYRTSGTMRATHACGISLLSDFAVDAGSINIGVANLITMSFEAQVRLDLWQNGTLVATDTVSGGVPGDPPHNHYALQIGSINPSFPADGDIAEVVIFDRVLSATERIALERILKDKYAI